MEFRTQKKRKEAEKFKSDFKIDKLRLVIYCRNSDSIHIEHAFDTMIPRAY